MAPPGLPHETRKGDPVTSHSHPAPDAPRPGDSDLPHDLPAAFRPVEFYSAVGQMLDLNRGDSLHHAWRVAAVAYRLGRRLSGFEAPLLYAAGLLADCGAIRFARHIVFDLADHPDTLGQKSQIHLFFHPVEGFELLRRLPGLRPVAQIVARHHEAVNGGGYPEGLRGDQIGLGAQILHLADIVDLLLRIDRPAREEDLLASLSVYAGEEFLASLLDPLREMFAGPLSLSTLLVPENLAQEIRRINTDLAGTMKFETVEDMDRLFEGIGVLIDLRAMSVSAGHSSVTARWTQAIGTRMGLSLRDLALLRWAASLMNMGEIQIRPPVLLKAGLLDESERLLMRTHPRIGFDLLSRVSGLSEAAALVRAHHENFDGTGYPDGRAGESIPLGSRILRVADTFSAMTAGRPYHRQRDWKKALKEMRKLSGSHFDPGVLDVAVEVFKE